MLPLIVLQALLRNPVDRRRYLRITGSQTALTLLLAIAVVPFYRSATEVTRQVEQEAELALQKTLGVVQEGFAAARQKPPAEDGEKVFLAALEQSAQGFRGELQALEVPPIPMPPPTGERIPVPPPAQPPPLSGGPENADRLRVRAQQRLERRLERQQQAREREAAQREEDQDALAAQQEARADALERAAELKAQALENAEEIREQMEAIRAAAAEAAVELRQVARNHPELAAELAVEQSQLQEEIARGQAELQQALAQNQARIARQMEALQRSTQGLATRSALRATEGVRQRAGELESSEDLEAALAVLERRLESGEEQAQLSPEERVEGAMQAAVEASFVAERAQQHLRQLRSQLPLPGASGTPPPSLEEAERLADQARALAGRARAEAKDRLSQVALSRRQGAEPPAPPEQLAKAMVELSPTRQLLVYLAALYAALYVVQFLVISFSREYHDQLSRQAALATGIAPEDPDLRPRVHLDWRWLRTRLARRWRALKLFGFGLPVIYLLTWPLPGDWARTLLLTLWGVYWFAVFVAAKSARAWVDEGLAPDPWFLRASGSLARRITLLGALPFRLYGSLWRRHGLAVFAPAECVEQQPYAFAGLTVFRFLASLPVLKLYLRPLTPIAVAHLLESHRQLHPPRAAKVAEVLARQRVSAEPGATLH